MKLSPALVGILAFIGCDAQKSNLGNSTAPSNDDVTRAQYLSLLQASGYDTAEVEETESAFVVDGDAIVSKSSLKELGRALGASSVAARKQQQYLVTVLAKNVRQASISLNIPDFPVELVDKAISAWNTTNSGVNFHRLNSPADIRIVGVTPAQMIEIGCGSTAVGCADTPDYHFPDGYLYPGEEIFIRDDWWRAQIKNGKSDQVVWAIMHELGHTVGFMHTNETAGRYIPGTPDPTYGQVDKSSVMRSYVAADNVQFSIFDYYAFNRIYPTPRTYAIEPNFYLYMYPDIARAFGSNFGSVYDHFFQYGIYEWRTGSTTFEAKYYLEANSDLLRAFGRNVTSAKNHWERYGLSEGRQSSPTFDISYYKKNNASLAGMNNTQVLDHFINNGVYEGRRSCVTFDPIFYMNNNADVRAAFGKFNYTFALYHWYKVGMREGRTGSGDFNVKTWLAANPEMSKKFGSDYEAAIRYYEAGH